LRNRDIQIPIRVNDNEYLKLHKLASDSGLPRETVIRKLIMGEKIRARPPDEYVEIYRLVSNIANNVNQIAHVANATATVRKEQIDAVLMMVNKCWIKIKDIY